MLRLVLLVVYLTAPFFLTQGPLTSDTSATSHGWDPNGSDTGHGWDPDGSDIGGGLDPDGLDIGGGLDPNG